jgi:hypothetical protein
VGEPPVGADWSSGPVGHGSASASCRGVRFSDGFCWFFVQISVCVCGKFLSVCRAEWVLISIFIFLFEMLEKNTESG